MKNELETPKVEMLLNTIGRDSILSNKDAIWLHDVAQILHDHGEYTKCIYLNRLIRKAGRAKEMEILTYEKASELAELRFKAGQGAWDSYVDSNYGSLITWVNKRLINMLEQDANRNTLSFTLDYTLLFGIFNESAPHQPTSGLGDIARRLYDDLDEAGWTLQSRTLSDESLELTITKADEPEVVVPAWGTGFLKRIIKK